MPADPIHPDQLGGAARFRADLVAYLDSLPLDQLADLLSELPNRQQPLGLGVLMVALNERLPDAYKLLPPAGQPGPGEGPRRSLRELVADCQESGATSAERDRDRQGQERDREPEDDFSDSWRAYRDAPSTSGRPMAGRCRSRRHAPSLGNRWTATTTRSTTSRQTGRGDGWVRSATARMADGSAARPSASPDPMPGLAVTAWTVAAGRAECDDRACVTGARSVVQQAEWCGVAGLATDAHDEVAPPRPRLRQSPPVAATCS